MSGSTEVKEKITAFLAQWSGPDDAMQSCWQQLWQTVTAFADIELSFVARPGISYSLRPKHIHQSRRALFAMIDVIDDDPADRWLSVCFYGDMITDPQGRGEVVPAGLAGEDGYCFDLSAANSDWVVYLQERLQEAWQSAKAGESAVT